MNQTRKYHRTEAAQITNFRSESEGSQTQPNSSVSAHERWDIELRIGVNPPQYVSLQLNDKLTIGCAESETGYVPDLDLSLFGGHEAGVSHRHGVLQAALGVLHLIDLGRTAGTSCNGYTLDPNKLYKVHEGDVLEFGQLRIDVMKARKSHGSSPESISDQPVLHSLKQVPYDTVWRIIRYFHNQSTEHLGSNTPIPDGDGNDAKLQRDKLQSQELGAIAEMSRSTESDIALPYQYVSVPTGQHYSWGILLSIGEESPTYVRLNVKDECVIGHADPVSGFVPDLDLTPFGGKFAGVAPRHAVLLARPGGLHIRNLYNLSSTSLNGRPLTPDHLYSLYEGDTLELGELRIRVGAARLTSMFSVLNSSSTPTVSTLPADEAPEAVPTGRILDLQQPAASIVQAEGLSAIVERQVTDQPAPASEPSLETANQEPPSFQPLREGDGMASNLSPNTQQRPPSAPATNWQNASWRVVLDIPTGPAQAVKIDLKTQLTIGYADPAANFTPDLDLTSYRAQEAGLSHRHAILLGALGGPHIRDLDSSGGTSLNGVSLDANKLYLLHEGDFLDLGKLRIQIRTVRLLPEAQLKAGATTTPDQAASRVSVEAIRRVINHLIHLPEGYAPAPDASLLDTKPSRAKVPATTGLLKWKPNQQTTRRMTQEVLRPAENVVNMVPHLAPEVLPDPRETLVLRRLNFPWHIMLRIGTNPAIEVKPNAKNQITIGHADPSTGFVPDLDLTPYGAHKAGVSRRHAVLQVERDTLNVRDLGSLNGTVLNGFVLDPNKAYKLREGDILELGEMSIEVRVVPQSDTFPLPSPEPKPVAPQSAATSALKGTALLPQPPRDREHLTAPSKNASGSWRRKQKAEMKEIEEAPTVEEIKRKSTDNTLPAWVVPKGSVAFAGRPIPVRKTAPPPSWRAAETTRVTKPAAKRQSSAGLRRKPLTIAASIVVGLLLLVGVGATLTDRTESAKPTAASAKVNTPGGSSADEAFNYFRKMGDAVSNFETFSVPNSTWKASEEIRFDVADQAGKGSILILHYDSPEQAASDAARVAGTEAAQDFIITPVSNFVVVSVPGTPPSLSVGAVYRMKQYLMTVGIPAPPTSNQK